MTIDNKKIDIPMTIQLEDELNREKYKYKYIKIFKSTIFTLLIIVALAVLLATLFLPVFEIYGNSMTPTLTEGDIVVGISQKKLDNSDIIAFYYNNKILVKRVIATSSQWVNIDKEGNVFVDNILLEELYIDKKSYGEVDIDFPYQVPEGSYFVLGDKRELSIDSRNSLLGTISEEDVIGKVVFRVWPIKSIGAVG